jgi:GTP pyrophosphokinase
MNNVIQRAFDFALRAHKGQKYGDKPFSTHPVQVARIIKLLCPLDYELQAAAYLHDVLEETTTTPAELTELFGKDITGLVYEVTKTNYNTFPNLKTRRGVILKYADRLCNLVKMQSWDVDKQQIYIEKSKFWQS